MKSRFVFFIFASLFLVSSLTGCAAFRKKFVRKQPPKAPEETFYTPKAYKRSVSVENEYLEYFYSWKRSHEELIDNLGGYYKKEIASCRRTIDNLSYMRNMLKPEKSDVLTNYINRLNIIHQEIKDSRGSFTSGRFNALYGELSGIYNSVRKEYPYNKIKDFIKADE